jgi:hypothetical protein
MSHESVETFRILDGALDGPAPIVNANFSSPEGALVLSLCAHASPAPIHNAAATTYFIMILINASSKVQPRYEGA